MSPSAVQARTRPRLRLYGSWKDLPAGYAEMFARAGAEDFCLGRAWFETLGASILEGQDRLAIAGIEMAGPSPWPFACLVGRHRERDPLFFGARSFSSLSNYYSPRYVPMVAHGNAGAALCGLIEGLRARRPRYAALHFEPLARDEPLVDDLAAALRATGFVTRCYFRFGNWHEHTRNLSFDDYLAHRPAALRQTFARKSARLARAGPVRVAVVEGGTELPEALEHYQRVYAGSWKRSEPYPQFIGRLAHCVADAGALRFGLLYLDECPIAAQIWIVQRGTATLYKLVHDQGFDSFSPGTVLTMRMLERLLDRERITELDLGIGDDPYKRLWASQRRERIGLVGFDLRSWRGTFGALWHRRGATF
jgi:hypothetical protein